MPVSVGPLARHSARAVTVSSGTWHTRRKTALTAVLPPPASTVGMRSGARSERMCACRLHADPGAECRYDSRLVRSFAGHIPSRNALAVRSTPRLTETSVAKLYAARSPGDRGGRHPQRGALPGLWPRELQGPETREVVVREIPSVAPPPSCGCSGASSVRTAGSAPPRTIPRSRASSPAGWPGS